VGLACEDAVSGGALSKVPKSIESISVSVTPRPAICVITPLAMARFSNELYEAAIQYLPKEDGFSPVRYFLFCGSIELAMKAAILAQDCSPKKISKLQKKIGHNLTKLLRRFEVEVCTDLFDDIQKKAISAINPFFQHKSMEYFSVNEKMPSADMMRSALHGHKDFPLLEELQAAATRANSFLVDKNNFVDAKTSVEPNGGIINFV